MIRIIQGSEREIPRVFAPELAMLVGIDRRLCNLGKGEGHRPPILLRDDRLDGLAAIDTLRRDQTGLLREVVAEQEAARSGLIGD